MKKIFILTVVFCFMHGFANAQNFDSLNKEVTEPATTQTATSGNCVDDPRLETEIISIMESNTPVNPPITVTPETYLTLEGDIIKRLAGQMVICPNNPILKSGKPMKKIVIEFEPVWQAIQNAAAKGDMESVEKYVNGFTVKPKTITEITSLLTPFQLEDKKQEALYRAAGLTSKREDSDVLDFYIRMGGKPSEDGVVLITRGKIDSLDKYKDKFKKNVYNIEGEIGYPRWKSRRDKLKSMGIQVEVE